MQAQYLIRIDDVWEGMNWSVFDQVEALLLRHGVRPIVAVIPENRDDTLVVGPRCADFWDRVRRWADQQWTIAVHGWQHRINTCDGGIIALNRKSEFAGLPADVQRHALKQALGVFLRQGIAPRVFVAPWHSFDRITLRVLMENGLTVLSDGLFAWPGLDRNGIFWVPQQLWKLRPMPPGVWTVCLHLNGWTAREIEIFDRMLSSNLRITNLEEVLVSFSKRRLSRTDWLLQSVASRVLAFRQSWRHRRC